MWLLFRLTSSLDEHLVIYYLVPLPRIGLERERTGSRGEIARGRVYIYMLYAGRIMEGKREGKKKCLLITKLNEIY